MLADGKPVEKALTLLHFTQRGNGKPHARGIRIFTEQVRDATAGDSYPYYCTVALCTMEKVLDFTAEKGVTAIAVLCKVGAPSKPDHHAADLYIEAMEPVKKDDIPQCLQMMQQLTKISSTETTDTAISSKGAWEPRKCRRLNGYPTEPEMEP